MTVIIGAVVVVLGFAGLVALAYWTARSNSR